MTSPTIQHLLGYLTPEQWADALTDTHPEADNETVKELIREQEERYGTNLMDEVERQKQIKESR